MSQDVLEIVVLAAIAMGVVARLYSYFGRRTGAERPVEQPPGPAAALPRAPAPAIPASARAPAGAGFSDILRADPGFDAPHFLSGARKAYELIVAAYAAGDREALRPLLTAKVFTAYDQALKDRDASGAKGPDLVRLKSAELGDGELDGATARINVTFEAELAEGAHGLRDTKERWIFERDTTARDPNWRLAGVAQA